jgi:hypothetical protein
MTSTAAPPIRVQTWADDLRLPCFAASADTANLLVSLESLRKPATPFQSKHLPALKRGVWFVLRRPADRSRTGLLCVWPAQNCCVYVSGEPATPKRPTPRIALLRIRVDPQFLHPTAGLTVFAATLSPSTRRLMLEDTLLWKGRPVAETETFRDRHRRLSQWLEHYALMDPRLLCGLEITGAPWSPLASVEPEGVWDLVTADEPGHRRLLWVANHAPAEYHSPALSAVAVATAVGAPVPEIPQLDLGVAGPSAGPLVALATREGGPDQWGLTSADGAGLGRLLVRTMALSAELRASRGPAVRVEVVWAPTFRKWEAVRLSQDPVSHRSAFEAATISHVV